MVIPGDEPVADSYAELFPTVDGLFELISHHLACGTAIVEVTYERTFGYPVRAAIGRPFPDGVVVYQTSQFSAGVNCIPTALRRALWRSLPKC